MIEAMACGTPVAAYPVQGPVDVVGAGGCLSDDLQKAIEGAMNLDREAVAQYAEQFDWKIATEQFLSGLSHVESGEPLLP
jgi:glycosyltransferase involved in cell wall biosynthesis